MTREELLKDAECAIKKANHLNDNDASNAHTLYAIACILLARELRESKESEHGAVKYIEHGDE